MRAIVLREHGGPDVLVEEELPPPTPGPGEVLVRVQAVALNHMDVWVRRGLPGLKMRYPHLLGCDIAGTVEGEGTAVVLNPGVSCMSCRECLSGRDNLCRSYGILGEHLPGGYGELVAVPRANLVPRPAGLTDAEAAAFPLTMLTAWQMLVRKARVEPGETVLVVGAGSGVGSAGVQIAKLLGARVIATATSDDKLERARELGADDVVNTSTTDLALAVKTLTGKRGADVVFEHVGKAVWEKVILATARGGRIVTCGATSGYEAMTDLRHVFYRQISILGSTMGPKGDLFTIADHVAAGRLRPVVDRVLPFTVDSAREAHRLLEERAQFGKIVLAVGAPA